MAFHFHWPHDALLEMEHPERKRWVEEISRINQRANDRPLQGLPS